MQKDDQNWKWDIQPLSKVEMLRELQKEVAIHVKSLIEQLPELQKLVNMLDTKVTEYILHKKEFLLHELQDMKDDFELQKQRLRDFLRHLELREWQLKELQTRIELQQQEQRIELLESQEDQLHLQKCLELMEQQEYLHKEVLDCMNFQARMKSSTIAMEASLQKGLELLRIDLIIPQLNEEIQCAEGVNEQLKQTHLMLLIKLNKLPEPCYENIPKRRRNSV